MSWVGKRVVATGVLLQRSDSFLRATGWYRSVLHQRPVNQAGDPIPWITYPATDFLAERIDDTLRVFEYGSGTSTSWWAHRVESVTSVEHDRDWHDHALDGLPSNASCLLRTDQSSYVQAIGTGPFDVVVIDGKWRNECAETAVEALSEVGVIVWDNSERSEYTAGIQMLTNQGFRRLPFRGQGPLNAYPWETSVFYRDRNCLGI